MKENALDFVDVKFTINDFHWRKISNQKLINYTVVQAIISLHMLYQI